MTAFQILKSRVGQFSQLLLMRLYAAGASFILTLILGRLLGPEGFGVYAFVLGWVGIAVLFTTFGLQHLAVRALPYMLVRENRAGATGFTLAAICTVAALSLTVCLFVVANPSVLAHEPAMQSAIAAGAVLLVVRSVNLLRTGVLQGLGHPIAGQAPERLVEPTLMLIAVALWISFSDGLTARGAIFLTVGAGVISLALGARSLFRAVAAIWSRPAFSNASEWIVEAGKSSVLFGAATVLGATDVVMLGYLSTAEETGLYGVAARFFLLIALPVQAAGVRISQRAARLHAENDMPALEVLARGLANRVLLASLALAVPSTFAAVHIEWIFGEGFAGAALPLLILVWSRVVIAAAGSPGLILANARSAGAVAITAVAAAVCNIVLNAGLVPLFGANGAAVATVASLGFMTLADTAMLFRRLGIFAFVTRSPWSGSLRGAP